MEQALVSVLIPAYNAASTIGLAIESCMQQTYEKIEVIVLDDASEDDTVKKIATYTKVRIIHNAENRGAANARNRLLKEAKGTYIAWLDADDTMASVRIERQVQFLQSHPETDIVGSWIKTDNTNVPFRKFPLDPGVIKAHLWFKNCMAQPAVMSRNFYAGENIWYDEEFRFMQDYELWFRLRDKKGFANIPEYLTAYHVSTETESALKHAPAAESRLPEKLWAQKWAEGTYGLSETYQVSLARFLQTNNIVSHQEGKHIGAALKLLASNAAFSSKHENRLMVHFYRLLLWKRLELSAKLLQCFLLTSMLHYPKLKGLNLIQ